MPALKSFAIGLSDSDVLPIDPELGPADSIPLLELSATMEVEAESEAPEPAPARESLESAIASRVAEPVPCLLPSPADPSPNAAALSTSAPSSSEAVVTWQPRRRSFGWIVGSAAAASGTVILLGWGLAPTNASAESATAADAPAPVVVRAEVPEPEAQPAVVASEKAPDSRKTARKWATIGNRELTEGNTATAQKMFERALTAQSNNRMAHSGLGQIALRRKQPRKAVEHLRMAVEIGPRKADNRRLLAQAYMALGGKAKARTHLEKAISYGDIPAQQLLMEL